MKKQLPFPKVIKLLLVLTILPVIFYSGVSFGDDEEMQIKTGTIILQQVYDYPRLAMITMDDAKEITLTNIKGDVLQIGLEEENGFLVYEVLLVTPERTLTEVTVDAGNGQILSVEEDDEDEDDDGNESNC